MAIPGFNVRKAAQVTAFFAMRQGGSINVLKLSKLLYLADREFMSRYDMPILFDRLVSMDHGPVDSVTLNYVNGYIDGRGTWDEFITDRAGYSVGLANPLLEVEQLDELSEAEIEVLDDVWRKFGHMDQFQLRDYTHEHCPEWEDPDGSSNPIPYARVFKFLGKAKSEELARNVEAVREMSAALEHAK